MYANNRKKPIDCWIAYGKVLVFTASKTLGFGLEHIDNLGKQMLYISWDSSVAKRFFHICPFISILSATNLLQLLMSSPPAVHGNNLLIGLSLGASPSLTTLYKSLD